MELEDFAEVLTFRPVLKKKIEKLVKKEGIIAIHYLICNCNHLFCEHNKITGSCKKVLQLASHNSVVQTSYCHCDKFILNSQNTYERTGWSL